MSDSLSIRRRAADALAVAIAAAVPALVGKVEATFADEEERKPTPSLRILPKRMRLELFQALEVLATEGGGDLVVKIGEWLGEYEIELATDSRVERELLEESVLALWQLDVERPGVLVLSLPNAPAVSASGPIATSYEAIAAFILDDEEWHDERVFQKKRDSLLSITVELPALVLTSDVPETTTLQLYLDKLRQQESDVVDKSEQSTIADDGTIATIEV